MRDKQYPPKSYRLSDEIKMDLEKTKQKLKLSWNLLFKKLLDTFHEKDK